MVGTGCESAGFEEKVFSSFPFLGQGYRGFFLTKTYLISVLFCIIILISTKLQIVELGVYSQQIAAGNCYNDHNMSILNKIVEND